MKTGTIITALLSSFLLIGMAAAASMPAHAQTVTATPTYDPFAQPPLSENPSQLELGRYLFWRYCMPCHGDVGQGLTDEFRGEWEPDHQNCWERGCHSGLYAEDSFPVPTIVPALVNMGVPDRYNPDSLFDFLRTTHPPEDPGLLTDEEYRALILLLYHMNDIPLPAPTATATPAPSATSTSPAWLTPTFSLPPSTEAESPLGLWPVIGLAVILTALLLLRQRREES